MRTRAGVLLFDVPGAGTAHVAAEDAGRLNGEQGEVDGAGEKKRGKWLAS